MRKYLILILTVIWGAIVFLPGSALLAQALLRTFVAILPMLIAILLVGDSDVRWRCNLRRFYGSAMPTFFLAINGGSLLSIPYILTGILLVWPEIGRLCPKDGVWRNTARYGAGVGLLGLFIWWHWFHNPLPKDQEMIEHFNAHRTEFEQLIAGYRNHRGEHFYQNSSPEVRVMMRKAGVNDIVEAGGDFGRWFPDPYSQHTLQVQKDLYGGLVNKKLNKEEFIEICEREFPKLFNNRAAVEYLTELSKLTTPVKFYLGPDPATVQWGKTTLRYFGSFLNKGFCHYPQPPRVENDRILDTDYLLVDHSYLRPGLRVIESLDEYPNDWERGECVLKRIDAHWFIFMCRNTP